MLIRIVRMTFQEEKVGDFLRIFDENKEKIRNSPGCRHLELWQDENQKNIFTTYSIWDSENSLNQYRDSELFKSVWIPTKTLFGDRPFAFSSKKIDELG